MFKDTRRLPTPNRLHAMQQDRSSDRHRLAFLTPHPGPARLTRGATRLAAALGLLITVTAAPLAAQGLKLAVGDVGLGLGDVPRLDGIRLNYRDGELIRVRGLNATIWEPYDDAVGGSIEGLALGLPLTGGLDVRGLSVGAGIAADRELAGIGLGILGLGAGDRLAGIMAGGLGVGTGGDMDGIMLGGLGGGAGGDLRGVLVGGLGGGVSGSAKGIVIGGLGLGAGGDLEGIAVGGLGVGASGDVKGLILGGIGAGAGQGFTGIGIGGVGIGAGGDVKGLIVGGVGAGASGDVEGVAIGGVGIGAGGEIRGLAIGGAGVGAQSIKGVAIGFGVGARDTNALVIAPAFFKATEEGTMRGVAVSAYSRTVGRQNGLTIGLLNIADELHGVQVGLINIAKNKSRWRVLPLVNWN